MPESKILDIDFGDVFENITKIKNATAELRAENDKLADSIKKDGDATGELNKQLLQNEAQLRALGKEQRTMNKLVDDSIKAERSQKGSIEANRAELSKLTAEYIKLAKPTQEQTARIKALSDTLKKQEAALGDTRRNVGNYEEAIVNAGNKLRLFGVGLGDVSKKLNGAKTFLVAKRTAMIADAAATGGATIATTAFGIALGVATGGLTIVLAALASAIVYLTKTERGMDLLKIATDAVGAAIKVITDRVAQFGEGILLISQFRAVEGLKKIKDSFTGIGAEMKKEVSQSIELTKALDAVDDAEIALIETRAKREKQISELRVSAKDETKSLDERTKALKEAIELEESILDDELNIAKQRARISQERIDAGEATEDQRKENAEAQAKVDELETASNDRKRALLRELNGLNKKNAAEDEKINKSKEKADKEQKERDEKKLEDIKKRLEERLKDEQQYFDEQQLIEKENFANGVINKEEYNKRIAELQIGEAEATIQILETFGQEVADKQIELDNLVADNKIAIREKDIEHQQEINERINEINEELVDAEREIQESRVDIAQGAFGTIENLAKEGSALQQLAFLGSQAAAIADVIISTQKQFAAIAEATALQVASAAVLPFPANLAAEAAITAKGVAKKIIAGIQGGISVASIAGTTIKGFLAEGGEIPTGEGRVYDIGGKPHSQRGTKFYGEDGNVIEMEKGEKAFVLKESASRFIERYSMINQLHGGKSWLTGQPVRHAATGGQIATSFDGGFGARQSLLNVEQQIAQENLANAIRNMPQPVVRVTEINRVQKSTQSSVEVSEL